MFNHRHHISRHLHLEILILTGMGTPYRHCRLPPIGATGTLFSLVTWWNSFYYLCAYHSILVAVETLMKISHDFYFSLVTLILMTLTFSFVDKKTSYISSSHHLLSIQVHVNTFTIEELKAEFNIELNYKPGIFSLYTH